MKYIKKLKYLIAWLVATFPSTAFAITAGCSNLPGKQLNTIFGCINVDSEVLRNFVRLVYQTSLSIASVAAVVVIIFAGIKYITASGNPDTIRDAKDMITKSLWALLLLFFAAVMFRAFGLNTAGLEAPGTP